ncbi:[Fe-Fe] hydrogenase large subunit C-terminal domain-containing protein [Capillibacterium thermochitinicola]|uniref:PAS domain-containing protein n=1 Tax=Capillibacterium thermochitinicola TaxID=2699427 RepID=A0A8J6LLF8_9FIRM|nr:[Fe-Fe] hydrogenase large subunit C-terminal domain-containing protein [Capillibacterium thermochitinicola]MBA2132063.1 PAS domain-containing protein [Capillibacterium thermochitinicola]
MGIISTIEASCRDCYKCVRSCPVKAIKITGGHAEVVEARCIADGRCVLVCPQQAKKVADGKGLVRSFFLAKQKLAASLAPSFVALDEFSRPGQLVTALRKLGFTYVAETAEAAELVAQDHLRLVEEKTGPVLTSCCPVVVNLIERYYPALIKYLAPVVSPMIAHGRLLKARYGPDLKVVFIGPCISKKDEYRRTELQGSIDAVLTFQELREMLAEEGIALEEMADGAFDRSGGAARVFPHPAGLAKTVRLSTDLLAQEIVAIDGLDAVIDFLTRFEEVKNSLRLVELLACAGGCLMGPGLESSLSLYARRERLLRYAQNGTDQPATTTEDDPKVRLATVYTKRKLNRITPTEEAIRAVLSKTGKHKPADELNCGACGYNSCREKAVAVLEGLAEIDMCIPYMRTKAESRASLICTMTPNAIFVVDRNLRILEVNPAAEKKFLCRQEQVVGKELEILIDPVYFKEALRTKELVTGEVAYPAYGIVTWQAIFYVETEEVLIGIFVDITKEHKQRERLALVKGETLTKAQEVIDKQMRVAQEIAGLLGETTAETKVLLTKLIKMIKNGDGSIQ